MAWPCRLFTRFRYLTDFQENTKYCIIDVPSQYQII